MIYRAIGIMSGSSLDGLDIAFVEFHETAGKWTYEIKAADCQPYSEEWVKRLRGAIQLNALDYQLLHTEYGHYIGEQVNALLLNITCITRCSSFPLTVILPFMRRLKK
jgi:anhydro-N-acetylmuramic acid kinase